GWGSKALDFVELITELRKYDDLEIIAFDAPGNGSSEGELTNLLLYMKAVIAVSGRYGVPDAFIGHSLGAMANILAADELEGDNPKLLISISPLIKIKEHFVSIMTSVNASEKAQNNFFSSFQFRFNVPADHFDLVTLYSSQRKHLVLYDPDDPVSPQNYLLEFLSKNPGIESISFDHIGHERMHRDPQVIKEVVTFVIGNRDNQHTHGS
ncbi:MAG TPA: alpha/beta hydrolase, partial [Sphingobacteriaceae bacterium]